MGQRADRYQVKKKRILYYTDCFIFGGCEKPIFEVIGSRDFVSGYDYSIIFRSSKEYVEGLASFRPSFPKEKLTGIKLLDVVFVNIYLTKKISNQFIMRMLRKFMTVLFLFLTPFIFIYDLILLSYLFNKKKVDVIHINNGGYPAALSCRAAAVAARFAGIKKIILSIHSTAVKDAGFADKVIDFFVKRSVGVIVTGSRASGLALVKNRGFDQSKIITIYHGVRPSGIATGKRPVGDDACLGRYISMVARFEDRKGHRYAVQAFKKVIEGNPLFSDLKLVLVGDGPVLDDIKELVASEGIGNNVRFMGHRNDYADYVASSLFLLNPSTGYEDLPYVIIEAMSLGVPVIGTDIAGIPEEIEDGVTGIVVPPKDSAALERAILKMLSDEESRIRMGRAAQERFHELFTMDKMVNNYLRLYSDAY